MYFFDLDIKINVTLYFSHTIDSLASFPLYGVSEDGGLLGAEGLDAGLGLGAPAHDAEDDGDGRDLDLALVSAH